MNKLEKYLSESNADGITKLANELINTGDNELIEFANYLLHLMPQSNHQ